MAASRARDVEERSRARGAVWRRKVASISQGGNDGSGRRLTKRRVEAGGFSQEGKMRNQHGGQRPGSGQHGGQRPGSGQHGGQRPGAGQHGGQRPGAGQHGGQRPGSGQHGGQRPGAGQNGIPRPSSGQAKRKWRHDNLQQKRFEGSAKEGQGFALWRKQKVQLQYKKLLRKHQKTAVPKEDLYAVNYPEHLKHLYLAEEERLKNQESKRKQEREQPLMTEDPEEELSHTAEEPTEELSQATVQHQALLPPKKKAKKKTSVQKAKEEYERVQHERAKRKKEAEENRKKREEAKELYKKRKMEAFKVLSTKTKKGQPNFNVQMEYLLKKIQGKT